MLDLILLGEIPGTTIVITFEHWIILFSVLAPITLLIGGYLRRKKLLDEVHSLRGLRQSLRHTD